MIRTLLFSVMALGCASLFAGAEETAWTIDWANGTVGKVEKQELSPYLRINTRASEAFQPEIVEADGKSESPFVSGQKALLLKRGAGEGEGATIAAFSLPGGEGYAKGAFEIEFFLHPSQGKERESLRVHMRTREAAGSSKTTLACIFYITPTRLSILPLGSMESSIKTKARPIVGAVNTLKIEWDFDNKPGFWATLNGQPVVERTASGSEPSLFPIADSAGKAVREMHVYPGKNSTAFIGKVSAFLK